MLPHIEHFLEVVSIYLSSFFRFLSVFEQEILQYNPLVFGFLVKEELQIIHTQLLFMERVLSFTYFNTFISFQSI